MRTLVVALALVAATSLVVACGPEQDRADCGPGELYLFVSSDEGWPFGSPTGICDPLPDSCLEEPTCACLAASEPTELRDYAFCIEHASCDDSEDVVMVTCPAG